MLLLHVYLLLTRVRQADLDALWWLYENTGGASWRHNENWDREKVARSSTCHSAPGYQWQPLCGGAGPMQAARGARAVPV